MIELKSIKMKSSSSVHSTLNQHCQYLLEFNFWADESNSCPAVRDSFV